MVPFPMQPQLARLQDRLPSGPGWAYEPKWDGFRCLLFKGGGSVRLQSRNGKDLSRSFPEIVRGARKLPDVVVDGELIGYRDGRQDFEILLERLTGQGGEPAALVVFDLVALDGEDLRPRSFAERRDALEGLSSSPFAVTPQTNDRSVAELWLAEGFSLGFEGVVAKKLAFPYEGGIRNMVKVKHFETVDVLVGGYTGPPGDPRGLVLGLFDDKGVLHHVGTTSMLPHGVRADVAALTPCENPFDGLQPGRSRWPSHRFDEWTPVEPSRVCEIAFSRLDGMRFRHSVRFGRWRPDLDAASCTYDQLERFRDSGRELGPRKTLGGGGEI